MCSASSLQCEGTFRVPSSRGQVLREEGELGQRSWELQLVQRDVGGRGEGWWWKGSSSQRGRVRGAVLCGEGAGGVSLRSYGGGTWLPARTPHPILLQHLTPCTRHRPLPHQSALPALGPRRAKHCPGTAFSQQGSKPRGEQEEVSEGERREGEGGR